MNRNTAPVYAVGVGMTKFVKPGSQEDFDYPQMAQEAVGKALKDAHLSYSDVQAAVVGYVYGDSTCGQRALYEIGMSGIPIFNVNNNCSTGSSALLLAKNLVESGSADCVLAVGFEKMEKGSLESKFSDRTNPLDRHIDTMIDTYGYQPAPPMPQLFGNAGREHMKRYGTKAETFAKIALKNHKHSTNNPYSQFQQEYTLQQILESPMVFEPLTRLQCCPTSDGSAAVVVVSKDFVEKHILHSQAVEVLALTMATDLPSSFSEKNAIKLAGYDMTKLAAEHALNQAKVTITDVDVIELHDCFSANELITYEALGLCPEGKAEDFVEKGDNTYGGKYVINPSGGLISKGHPLGATGLAQCTELCWQLRGLAEKRQVPNAKLALQHNIGLGGAAVVGVYRLGFPVNSRSNNKLVEDVVDASNEEQSFKSYTAFNEVRKKLKKEGEKLVKKVNGIYLFKVDSGEKIGQWTVNMKSGSGSVSFGPNKSKADCTISMSDDDMHSLMTGKLNPQQAYFKGKLRINGSMILAMKLRDILPKNPISKL